MIERYTRPAMGRIWSEENKLQKWLEVEILACEALAQRGEIPRAAAVKIRELARIDSRRMREIEEEVKHDWQLETVCGLARLVRGYALSALENVPLWHERDISHSSVERVIGPDATILVDFMFSRMTRILEGLVVHTDRMAQNLSLLGRAIFSEPLLLSLVRKGASREDAYRWVQRNAMKVWEGGADFQAAVHQDLDITRLLSPEEIAAVFDLSQALKHVDTIFDRVFGEGKGKAEG